MPPSNTFLKIAIFGLGLLTLAFSLLPAFAHEKLITDPKPLETTTGTSQDLQGLDLSNDFLFESNTLQLSPSQLPYNSQESFYDIKTQKLNSTLEPLDNALGDTQRTTRRLPFVLFE